MIISIASGKGGTGKTTITTNLACALSENNKVLLLDCDVEEPNSHLFITTQKYEQKDVTIPVPTIDTQKCNKCGKCIEVCEFNVFANIGTDILIFKELCHGCGACSYFCTKHAIKEVPQKIAVTEFSKVDDNLDFAYGRLDIGQPMAPPVISKVKDYIKNNKAYDYYIIDSPPGTACPMVSTVNKSDYCILVTEPTPFGLNDLKLAVDVVRKLKIPFGIIINKHGLGNDDVENYCNSKEIKILFKLPFDRKLARSYSEGNIIIKDHPEYKELFLGIIKQITKDFKSKNNE